MMTDGRKRARFALSILLTAVVSSCSGPFDTGVLAVLPVDGEPSEADWQSAVPLDLEVWMGNVHERPEIVALDGETSHRSTAECHHGPAGSDPVAVRLLALYSDEEIFLRASWRDPTRDSANGRWRMENGGWVAEPQYDDGIALLWGPEGEEGFRCQSTCHMVDVDVFDGGTQMRMRMVNPEGPVLDLWRWRSAGTAPFGLADDMLIDQAGKRGDAGQDLRVENQARKTVGRDDGGTPVVPYYLVERPVDTQADVSTASRWDDGRWQVLFRRRLDTGDGGDRTLAPGVRIPFSIAVFDNTFTEHHVTESGLLMWLVDPSTAGGETGRNRDEPRDF